MWLFKTWIRLFGKGRTQAPAPELMQGPWSQVWQQAQSVSEGFGRVAELTRQYREAVFQGFDKVIALTHQYRDGVSTLERNLTALYEQSCATEDRYRTLLQKLTGLADYCEQLSANNEALGPVREQVSELLAAHSVKPYLPEEGKPVDLKRCVIEVPVPSETKPPGLVVKVISKGYLWGDITLVPAKVAATAEPDRAIQPDAASEAESTGPAASPSPTPRVEDQTRGGNSSTDERS